ncbi:tetratricopeptide repeat protein 1 isoform 2-T4 [Polymixia lowei]
MSLQGASQRSSQEDQEHFYDCQEVLEPPTSQGEEEGWGKGDGKERRKGGEEENMERRRGAEEENMERRRGTEEEENERRAPEGDSHHTQTLSDSQRAEESLLNSTEERSTAAGAVGTDEEEEEERWDRLVAEEEEQAGGGMDSDAEMKGEEIDTPEFDEEHLREVEKELTEEERESRRQESLVLKEKGNSQFKAGEHLDAERSYTEGLGVCPVCFGRERAVLFSNRAAARFHLDHKDKAISDCSRAIELNPDYVRAILRRAELYEKTDKLDEALEDYKTVLDKDPGQHTAREACMRLPQQIHDRNERLKEEMMTKLKDLGNMFLRPFGLSTNNFQVNQDTDTGSYSVNFVQNPNNNR